MVYGVPIKRPDYGGALEVLAQMEVAYRLAIACDPEWAAWAQRIVVRLMEAAVNARRRERSAKIGDGHVSGCRARRDMILSAGDVIRCRGGTGRRTDASRRAAVRLIASLCTDERRDPALGVFLRLACPDVHDEAGIAIARRDLLSALTHEDSEIRERAMRVLASCPAQKTADAWARRPARLCA